VPNGVNNTQAPDVADIAEVSRESATGSASFAGLTRCLAQHPSTFQNVTRVRKSKLIVGASSDNKCLKAVIMKQMCSYRVCTPKPLVMNLLTVCDRLVMV